MVARLAHRMALEPGDYTQLAQDYARYRAAYAPELPAALLRLARARPLDGAQAPPGNAESGQRGAARELVVVDVGAGTGIWTRMLARAGQRVLGIEPNAPMLAQARGGSEGCSIRWSRACAESTGLADRSCDLVTMASSFHWTDFERATAEFARVLRPGGCFAALWNTRELADDALLLGIEAELERRVPRLERRSSGRSAFCEGLAQRLRDCGRFTEVHYLEGTHVERFTRERYLGLWRSVNDVRAQAGESAFADFLEFVSERTAALDCIEARYRTRAWIARVP